MSELPKEWVTCKVSDFSHIVMGQSPASSTYNTEGIGPPFYQGKAEFGNFYPEPVKYCKAPKKIAEKGATLLSVRAPVGPTNITPHRSCIGRGLAGIHPLGGIPDRFILYLFRNYEPVLSGQGKGTTFKAITKDFLFDLIFALPPLSEQERILQSLEELFSDLDNAIENLKKAQEQLKVYRQAILWKGFEGGFTNGAKGWKTCRITDVCTLIDGDRGKNYPKKHELLEAGYCLFLSAKNVRPNGFEFKENIFISKEKHEKLRSGTLQKGDIVITTRGTLGNVALYDESVPFPVVRLNSGMLIFRLKTDELLNKYLAAFLRSPLFVWQIRKRKSGTAQPQLPANVLEEFEIKIPPVDVQNRIIQETDSRLSICDQAELTIEENLKKAQSLRQSILKQAFEGKLTEQWRKEHKDLISGENSAEALLKRIKAEKEALQAKSKGKKKHD